MRSVHSTRRSGSTGDLPGIVLLLIFLIVALICHIYLSGERGGKTEKFTIIGPSVMTPETKILTGQKIDINSASEQELAALPYIGERRAKDIVAFREENGLFERIESIMDVKGIGQRTLEKIRLYIIATSR